MVDETWLDPAKTAAVDEVAFDYLKAPGFHAIWVDGVVGGVTANGYVQFSLLSERPAIPRRQVYKLDAATGQLGAEVIEKRISRSSIVREMAVDVHMSADAAERLAHWLQERVHEIRARVVR